MSKIASRLANEHTLWNDLPVPAADSKSTNEDMVLSFAAVNQVLNDPITYSNRAFEPTLGHRDQGVQQLPL